MESSPSPSPSGPAEADKSLTTRLASVLPERVPFGIYHVSTPPRRTDALFSAPPNERPDRTYCENHFLAVSIGAAQPDKEQASSRKAASSAATTTTTPAETKKEVLVLGVEIFIYTTAHATTLFVSKADSTGYLSLLDLPRGAASPIRQVCAAFIAHLVEHRRRPGVQFVVSLFARSQGQYLFPGSVDHGGKHVLDDRGLIKWWCRVLDPLIVKPSPSGTGGPRGNRNGNGNGNVKGYLVVPGLDAHETRALIPRAATATAASSWSLAHPLEKISHYCREFDRVPPRCLIPRFPDDPKSRFRDELDDEAGRSGAAKQTGAWKSVKTLDTFWEMMAYRQECSSGRMTGFIWVVLDDDDDDEAAGDAVERAAAPRSPAKQTDAPPPATAASGTEPRRLPLLLSPRDSAARWKSKNGKSGKRRCKLRGPIRPRQPRAKTGQRNYSPTMPTRTAYYYWPSRGRGERIVNDATYRRITEHMLHADFSNLDKAAGSTKRWIREVGLGTHWGSVVTGERALSAPPANGTDASDKVNTISSGLVKRKRADTTDMTGGGVTDPDAEVAKKAPEDGANFLSAGIVRKKPKS
ncbi:hypothetical protein EsDP_00006714 [Epichloe bromicola]|uniref:histone acetyltransferase n=1 Tax=Epichloe bromicola TaxID=79588 RepID=A0ABQ0CYE8_9HYPO